MQDKLKLPFDEIYIQHLASLTDRECIISNLEETIENNIIVRNNTHIPLESNIVNFVNKNECEYLRRTTTFNCCLNHYTTIKQAYERGIESILVMEDDLIFNNNIDFVQKFFNIENIPSDWNILRYCVTFFDYLKESHSEMKNEYFLKYLSSSQYNFGNSGCYALNRTGMKYYIDYIDNHGYVPSDHPFMFSVSNANINHYIANSKEICDGLSANFNNSNLLNGRNRINTTI